jgi:hypothetical protein
MTNPALRGICLSTKLIDLRGINLSFSSSGGFGLRGINLSIPTTAVTTIQSAGAFKSGVTLC